MWWLMQTNVAGGEKDVTDFRLAFKVGVNLFHIYTTQQIVKVNLYHQLKDEADRKYAGRCSA
jgi:hypothetical protein